MIPIVQMQQHPNIAVLYTIRGQHVQSVHIFSPSSSPSQSVLMHVRKVNLPFYNYKNMESNRNNETKLEELKSKIDHYKD